MGKEKERKKENINVKLGGMEIHGTTSNKPIAGYQASGDIENAGQLDKGFKKVEESDRQPDASIKEGDQEDY
ncbi:hypothetical protein [Piscibacillus halophilus]|uniref:DUF4025 domain-containing protein n=1 Tax=Piscibacillus halophilus TaxID=571933 RepID=A0A1H9KB38_9BACI|nr:hypothetical protein [Piscibacillus halophilus]SEQ96075.1 hypothetical protein SAMN05216362_13636 [Piscibacillus halophilus]